MPATATGLSLDLRPDPSAAHTARAAVDREFGPQLNAEKLMDVRTAASSLITNCLRNKAGREPIHLRIWEEADQIQGEVSGDGGWTEPIATQVAEQGSGALQVLDVVSSRWGIGDHTVWFVI